jgi:hypothetical protein
MATVATLVAMSGTKHQTLAEATLAFDVTQVTPYRFDFRHISCYS